MIVSNFDLLSVGITAAGIGILGFTIFFNNPSSITNRTFLIFSLITVAWSIANYLQYQPSSSPEVGLWIVRIIAFLGCWHAFTFFQLCYVFPENKAKFTWEYFFIVIPLVAITSFLTLTPLVFRTVTGTSSSGAVTAIQNGPAIALFGVLSFLLIVSGIGILIWKVRQKTGLERNRIAMIGFGTFLTFICIVTFNLILPAAYDDARFLPLSALFIFPFIACTAYAIFRYGLLDIKVLTTEIVAFLLSTATLVEVLFSQSGIELLFYISVFGLVLAFSILMVQSVIKEVRQRELIEQQEKALEIANRQQEVLLHFISHEVKGYLTKSEAAFAAIVEGDYGTISDPLKAMTAAALDEVRRGVSTVMDLLEASNLKSGAVSYKMLPLNFRTLVEKIVEEQRPAAYEKRLGLDVQIADGAYVMRGDEEKLREHVIRNLIDNAIKYTPAGIVRIKLSDGDRKIHFSVQDSGVGITPEDMTKLFTEGGHGKDSIKVNVHSTGYGLFIAKQIVDAHSGKIWAESDGQGKGSRFVVEFHSIESGQKQGIAS